MANAARPTVVWKTEWRDQRRRTVPWLQILVVDMPLLEFTSHLLRVEGCQTEVKRLSKTVGSYAEERRFCCAPLGEAGPGLAMSSRRRVTRLCQVGHAIRHDHTPP